MTTQEAIEFLPLYAAADDSDYVRHYEPKQKQQKPRQMHRKAPETPFRMQLDEKMMNTYSGADLEDAKKVMICAICRVFTGGEFAQVKSISDSVNMPGQWWGYSGTGISYTEDVYNTALEVSRIFHNSEPLPCASNMVYASWNGSDIVLRDKWQDNSSAKRY